MIKKSMDIIDIYVVSKKYIDLLKNCFIDNIYYARHYWLFKIRCSSGKYFLKIEPGIRFHLSKVEAREKSIDKFTAFLRKHIRGAHINDLKQIGWERIIYMDLEKRSTIYRLVVEIIPRGFLVLLNGDKEILYANKFTELRDRIIKPKEKYRPPPGNIDYEEYFNTLRKKILIGKDLVRGVVRGWGLPGYLAEEILYRAGLYSERRRKINEVPGKDIDALIDVYKSLINEALEGRGYSVFINNSLELYTLYKPMLYIEVYDGETILHKDFNEAIDRFFTEYEKTYIASLESKKIEREISSLRKSIEEQEKIIKEYLDKASEYEEIYNILNENYVLVDGIIKCAKKIRKQYGWEKIPDLCSNIASYKKERGVIYIVIGDHKIPIDIRLGTRDNIIRYMREAGEYRGKAERAEKHLVSLQKKLSELTRRRREAETLVSRGFRPRFWYERFHWMFTRNGFLVIGGRDAGQNELVVKKYLDSNDIFLHADIHGAPATILKKNGREPSIEDIYDAGVIAACYSRAWREGFGYIDVFWVYGNQVSKKPPSGEYIGKGAFMIYGKKNYLRIELKLGLGVEENCDPIYGIYQRIIIGTPELVSERSLVYAVLVPGDNSIGETSKMLLKLFTKKIGEKKLGIRREEIMDRLPGSSNIVKIGVGKAKHIEEC